MPGLLPKDAIERARLDLNVNSSVPAQTLRVRRLDRPGEMYYLVIFGESTKAVAVAAVDAVSGAIQTSAHLSGARPHMSIGDNQARRLASPAAPAEVALVWRPCRASRSCLYPLWEVRCACEIVYVDQQGRVWKRLDPAGPGG